jgi:hypothetical protein
MSAHLDASVLLPTIVEQPASAAVDRFCLDWPDTLIMSDFAAAEVASGLSRLVRTRYLELDDAQARLADFDTWRAGATVAADLAAADARLANTYVRHFELMLRAPDALHAAICRRLGLTLVTLDRRLAEAARVLGLSVQIPST